MEVRLDDALLDRIDEVAAPGIDTGLNESNYNPPAVVDVGLRRRPVADRAAA